jgi:hypothetical protein
MSSEGIVSKIQDQINQLLTKKKKIDYIASVIETIQNPTFGGSEFSEIKEELDGLAILKLKELSDSIENDIDPMAPKGLGLSEEKIKILDILAEKALKRAEQPQSTPSAQNNVYSQQPSPKKDRVLGVAEKMEFAQQNRHLGGKHVQCIGEQGIAINGKVVGLDAPFVLVETTSGHTIEVPLEKVVVQ